MFEVLFHYGVKLGVGENVNPLVLAWFCKVSGVKVLTKMKD